MFEKDFENVKKKMKYKYSIWKIVEMKNRPYIDLPKNRNIYRLEKLGRNETNEE